MTSEPTTEIYRRRRIGCASGFALVLAGLVAAALALSSGDSGGSEAPRTTQPAAVDTAASASTSSPTPTMTSPSVPLPTFVAGAPKVQIYGDSFATGYGTALKAYAKDAGYQSDMVSKGSSGLTRPEYFDWPNHLNVWVNADGARLVVLGLGANDAQPILVNGQHYDVGTPEFAAEYKKRVAEVVELVTSRGKALLWVGTPTASSDQFGTELAVIRAMTQSAIDEAAASGQPVRYFDTWSGTYDRGDDHFHLTQDASRQLGHELLDVVKAMVPL